MSNQKGFPFPDELLHLKQTKEKLRTALEKSIDTVNRHDREYMEAKRYNAEYRHEIDPTEIFQNELLLKDIELYGKHAVSLRDKLMKMLDSPYFSRIDFKPDDDDETEIFYIGRFHFQYRGDVCIYDWRAPVSSMFYDYESGPAGFDAPAGRISGELLRKRQFKIQDGNMKYALESAVHIQDDVLQRELSSTSDEKMKSIIATLQKEQNQIIRNEDARICIIQGTAGSGKTSVALHRIAYLLYRRRDTLSARNIVILSPNKVFGDYISNVLPELGEEPVYEINFTELAEIQLGSTISFLPDKNPVETRDPVWQKREKLKSSMSFLKCMDSYLSQAIKDIFQAEDYTFDDFTVEKEWIKKRYEGYNQFPVQRRLKETASDIRERLAASNYMGLELPAKKVIRKDLKAMLRVKNTMTLYKNFYQYLQMTGYFSMPSPKTLEWADVYPYLYFLAHFEGLKKNQIIRHLVIDEMQDYTPVQYAVLEKIFHCDMTILGDFGQSIHPCRSFSLNELQELYPTAKTTVLTKSYRSSFEIISFAKKLLPGIQLVPVERHGERPQLIRCRNLQEETDQLKLLMNTFKTSGYTTLGIILKDSAGASRLYDALRQHCPVTLITPESREFSHGIMITTVHMSKGLEFDEVIIPSADHETYFSDYDRNLLYVACTRAMHRLTLLFCEPTKLIGNM